MTVTIYINIRSPFSRRFHMKFGFDWPSGFRGKDVGTLWTPEHVYILSSPCEPEGIGELIIVNKLKDRIVKRSASNSFDHLLCFIIVY